MKSSELAALVCSRVCHDIAGPVSAIGAAISVFDDENATDMRDDAMELLRSGADQIRAKLEYLRVCFGAAGAHSESLSVQELQTLTTGMFAQAKPELVWKMKCALVTKPTARVLLNLIWLGIDALPRGGIVCIEVDTFEDGKTHLKLSLTGKRLRFDDKFPDLLKGRIVQDNVDARSIQPFYTGLIAREAQGAVDVVLEEEKIQFLAHLGA